MKPCPFGEHLQHYWDRLTDLEQQMALDEEALYSLTPQAVATEIATTLTGTRVADVFCGAGGLTIALARAGKQVLASDTSSARLEMARENARLFDVSERIEFRQGDVREILPTLAPDSVLLDPPWGGTDYGKRDQFRLADFEPDGTELLRLSFSQTPQVAMRLPKNFVMSELNDVGHAYELQENFFEGGLLHYCVYFGGNPRPS
ncbi:MAG: methyltransferase domain-containing protein [Planctomycetota bacterium]